MSVGQPLPPLGVWQYHASGMGMQRPPRGGHDEHPHTAPSGYEQADITALHEACGCGGLEGQPTGMGHWMLVCATHAPIWHDIDTRHSASTESPQVQFAPSCVQPSPAVGALAGQPAGLTPPPVPEEPDVDVPLPPVPTTLPPHAAPNSPRRAAHAERATRMRH